MARTKNRKPADNIRDQESIADYRHPEATRKNNPPTKIAAEGYVPILPKAEYVNLSPRQKHGRSPCAPGSRAVARIAMEVHLPQSQETRPEELAIRNGRAPTIRCRRLWHSYWPATSGSNGRFRWGSTR
jgi:hypothetical protein